MTTATANDPWTETIEHDVEVVFRDGDGNVTRVLDLDRVHITFDDGTAPVSAYYGDGYTLATLDGVRAFVRRWLAAAHLTDDERIDGNVESEQRLRVQGATMLAVINHPGINSRGLLAAVRDEGAVRCNDSEIREAVQSLARDGLLTIADGPNRAKLHTPAPGVERDDWRDDYPPVVL